MARPKNMGYEKYATWTIDVPVDTWWGGFMHTQFTITMQLHIPATLDKLTITITKFDFTILPPSAKGGGFVDFIGFSWWDDQYKPHFDDQFFYNLNDPVPPGYDINNGGPGENWAVVESEIRQITSAQGSGFWDSLMWYYAWQRNDGAGVIGQHDSPVGLSHTWTLTDDDWDNEGQLKDRIIFYTYQRHRDNGGDEYLGPPHQAEYAHWLIDNLYWMTDDIFNWKYHPFAIRKGSDWYSCNRLNKEVGHGDGHSMIRKDGRWNGLWNDDMHGNRDAEAFFDDSPEGKGDYTFLPRVGIGANADRPKEQVHEWEDN